MIEQGVLILVVNKVFGDLISKAFSDGVDISKDVIKNAYQDRKSNSRNLQTQIYCVIIDSLNKFTCDKYKKRDELYDAAESILKGFFYGKCDVDAIKPGLKMIISDVNNDDCEAFLKILCHEISKDKYNVLYKEIDLLQKKQLYELIHNKFEERNQADKETHRKLENVLEKMSDNIEREFVITHNVNVKPVSYFTGREAEIKELRQKIEDGCKAILVSGMGGIGKTHICRKLFEEYLNKSTKNGSGLFRHIGYIVYTENMEFSLQRCLKYKKQNDSGQNPEAAWRELEYLASDGKLLLFVDNVNRPIKDDPGLQRLKNIPGTIIITSRQASMGDEFETYSIGLLDLEQCKEIYGKIRFKNNEQMFKAEDIADLEFIIETLAGQHTITVEHLANLARVKSWSAKRLREELDKKKFQLTYHKDGEQINIQNLYEALYDLSELTENEQNILEAFSAFPYVPLPLDICNKWLLKDAGSSEDDDILMGLYDKGWLQFDVESECFSMHPVFAQFINEKCKPKEESHSGLIEACKQSIETKGIGQDIVFYCPFVLSIAKKLQPARNTRLRELLKTMTAVAKDAKLELEKYINENRNLRNELTVLGEEIRVLLEMIEERQRLVAQLKELDYSMKENPDMIDVEKIAALGAAVSNMKIGSLRSKFSHIKELINKVNAEKLSLEVPEFANVAELEDVINVLDSEELAELGDFLGEVLKVLS